MTDTTIDQGPDQAPELTYRKRISVAATPSTVFALLTEPDRLRRWQSVVSSVDFQVGGGYDHLVVPGAVASGTFREIERDRRLVYTWGWEGNDAVPPGSSTVTVELSADGDRTIIDFTHEGLPDADAVASHKDGWDHFIGRLGVAAETGDAGANPWAAGPEDMDVIGASEASLAIMLDLLRDIDDDDLGRDTPCAEFTVDQLIEHMVGSLTALAGVAGTAMPALDPSADAEARMADVAGVALSAWRQRGLDGEVEFAGKATAPSVPMAIVIAELYVHAWDIAEALNQPFAPADHVTALADEAVRGVIPPDQAGAFAPPLPEDGLDAVEALMAFTGRAV